MSTETIDHIGFVQSVTDKSVIVSIDSSIACSGCHAEGACSMAGKEKKIIEVSGKYNVKPGDIVTILMEQSTGYIALLLGYIIPIITVIIVLITLLSLEIPELLAGLVSVSILMPYYIILFFFRKKINERFIFMLKV